MIRKSSIQTSCVRIFSDGVLRCFMEKLPATTQQRRLTLNLNSNQQKTSHSFFTFSIFWNLQISICAQARYFDFPESKSPYVEILCVFVQWRRAAWSHGGSSCHMLSNGDCDRLLHNNLRPSRCYSSACFGSCFSRSRSTAER